MKWSTFAAVLLVLSLAAVASAQGLATFGGMTCSQLTPDQLGEVEDAYGEECGVYIAAVDAESLAGQTGIKAGDILISVRLPDETDYYPIEADVALLAEFADRTEANDTHRLKILRKVDGEYSEITCQLGTPIGEEAPAQPQTDPAADGDDGDVEIAAGGGNYSFVSDDPTQVIAQAQDGSPLTQGDVDILGGLMAWSFGTQLCESQKGVVRDSMVMFWQAAGPQEVQQFNEGIRTLPNMIPQLQPNQREQMRMGVGQIFAQLAQGLEATMPGHPLAQVIAEVAMGAMGATTALAGEGTPYPLTQQDVDALLEYLCFQQQQMTGQIAVVTPEDHVQFTAECVRQYNEGTDEQKVQFANFDALWGQMRAAWAAAEMQQEQGLLDQQVQAWQNQYADQGIYDVGAGGDWSNAQPAGGWSGGAGGGGDASMNQFNFDMMQN
ncbi:MAG TPA: PDZ domain-containing protein, partial [Armatimonadota bacterium]|nr:PDZ domain-containing protein [Armatimonadota bacterium]